MKRWWWVVVFGVALWWWRGFRHEIKSSSIERDQIAKQRDQIAKPTDWPKPAKNQTGDKPRPQPTGLAKSLTTKVQILPATVGEKPKPPAPGQIQFEVKENGIAIGFGDVILGKVQEGPEVKTGYAIARRSRLWDSAFIPFSIQPGITNQHAIREAVDEIQKTTPIRFVPYDGQVDSVVFVPGTDLCASYVGRVGGAQPIFLSSRCTKHEILHELMHALGFVHEHSRVDRDKYVEVLWQNIEPDFWLQFWIVPDEYFHEYTGSVFDFDGESIMLYDQKAFAKSPGLESLRPKAGVIVNPSRGTLSRIDRERVFFLYGR